MGNSEEVSMYMRYGVAMIRRNLIVSASGFISTKSGKIHYGNFGYEPKSEKLPGIASYVVPRHLRNALCHMLIEIARKAEEGKITGFAGVIVFRDGSADVIALGAMRGASALVKTLSFDRAA